MKLKRRGYILFAYWVCKKSFIEIGDEVYKSKNDLIRAWDSHCDDKWDMVGRNKIHYFYLDIKSGKYYPLMKWKDDVYKQDRFLSPHKKVLSTKTF